MTTLYKTLEILNKEHLLEGYEDFSKNYADRNGGWLSYQLHKKRDFGVETAINALRYIRELKTFYLGRRSKVGAIVDDNIEALEQADLLKQAHLEDRYGIIQIKQ